MNSQGKNEGFNAVLPYAIAQDRYEDEISLVDLWIELARFKKPFLATFGLILALGALAIGFMHEERFSLTSMIQIGTVQTGDQLVPLETPEALRGKLANVLVPQATADWLARSGDIQPFETQVELVKNSDVVMLRNEAGEADISFYEDFQRQLVQRVIEDHRDRVLAHQSGIRSALNSARLRLENLQGRQVLEARQQLIDQEIAREKAGLEQLQSVLSEQTKATAGESAPITAAASQFGARIDAHRAMIRELELEKIALAADHAQEIAQQKSIVQDLERSLQDANHTRLISEPVRSLGPVNLSMPKAFAIMVVVAVVLAALATLLALFSDKVRQRRSELVG